MKNIFFWMLIFIPAAIISQFGNGPGGLTLILAMLGIVPLSHFLGEATENIASSLGPVPAGILNAALGNSVEMIIAGATLAAGEAEVYRPQFKLSQTCRN